MPLLTRYTFFMHTTNSQYTHITAYHTHVSSQHLYHVQTTCRAYIMYTALKSQHITYLFYFSYHTTSYHTISRLPQPRHTHISYLYHSHITFHYLQYHFNIKDITGITQPQYTDVTSHHAHERHITHTPYISHTITLYR